MPKNLSKTILITGATDGIGFETAKLLVKQGHTVLIHGRNQDKLKRVESELSILGHVQTYLADLASIDHVKSFAKAITHEHSSLDILMNNAGVLQTPDTITVDSLDVRFAVNTIAPYILTKALLPLLTNRDSRVINLSSAAQAPVNLQLLIGQASEQDPMKAYAQSKLALTMWSFFMAQSLDSHGPTIIALNPGSLLGSKMVKEGFGIAGKDIAIGAEILVRAALSDEFASASGQYFDNDLGQFSDPHPDAMNPKKITLLVENIEAFLGERHTE